MLVVVLNYFFSYSIHYHYLSYYHCSRRHRLYHYTSYYHYSRCHRLCYWFYPDCQRHLDYCWVDLDAQKQLLFNCHDKNCTKPFVACSFLAKIFINMWNKRIHNNIITLVNSPSSILSSSTSLSGSVFTMIVVASLFSPMLLDSRTAGSDAALWPRIRSISS